MFDRSDVLWREEPQTPAPTDDQARQVTRPGAPGHHTDRPATNPDDKRITDRDDKPEEWRDGEDRPRTTEGQASFERAQERERLDAHERARHTPAAEREREPLAQERQDRIRAARARQSSPAPEDRTRQERPGHRREHTARQHDPDARDRPRRTRTERTRDALADVGLYRAVSYTDLSEQHFDAHPFTTRRLVTQMMRAGLIEEHDATGPHGNTFTVITATERGRDAAHRAALDAGHVPEQQTWTGLVKPAELSHDTAVYRAALDERARIEADGGRVTRVRLDAELKSIVATATERARAAAGDRAADEAKLAAAQELGLPVQDGHVLYPDAQLDIEDADGVSGRVNVEIASDHYHAAAIAAKAGAGFAMHGSSPSAARNIGRALARETDSGPGGGSASPGRDGSVEL